MQKENGFSREFLNAFVDNQLAPEEKSRAYDEIGRDEGLNRQVCELRKLHDLVQLAYREIPAPPARPAAPALRRSRTGVAAAIAVLSVGIVLGTQIQTPVAVQEQVADRAPVAVTPAATTADRAAAPNRIAPARVVTVAQSPMPTVRPAPVAVMPDLPTASAPRSINEVHIGNVRNKVLIHIANDDPAHLAQAIEDIEGVMRHYRDSGASAHVEVVINGRGLELVRVDTSKHAARIARLLNEYDNLTFAACQNTIDRLKNEQGITARLLPGVVVTDSGMAEITRRQHQGWTYLQV